MNWIVQHTSAWYTYIKYRQYIYIYFNIFIIEHVTVVVLVQYFIYHWKLLFIILLWLSLFFILLISFGWSFFSCTHSSITMWAQSKCKRATKSRLCLFVNELMYLLKIVRFIEKIDICTAKWNDPICFRLFYTLEKLDHCFISADLLVLFCWKIHHYVFIVGFNLFVCSMKNVRLINYKK